MAIKEARGGVYVHVALCKSKCIYCDFYSEVCKSDTDWKRYVNALLNEFKSRRAELAGMNEITLYIGGGTPSLLPSDLLTELIAGIRKISFDNVDSLKIIETTIEVNPDDVSVERAKTWRDAGVDRVSMGVQSLNDNELRKIGRRHNALAAQNAYKVLVDIFDNVSLDLMFGLPGQTLDSLSSTIDAFIKMRPQHISAYSLMYEERTAITRLRDAGKIEEADENLSIEMFRMINDRLKKAGYLRYEISNYALPGFESKHNSAYWNRTPYIGLGPSAHSFDGDRRRRWNVADIRKYLNGVGSKEDWFEIETLTDTEIAEEYIMTGLRTAEGIDLRHYEEMFGKKAVDQLVEKAQKLIKTGLLEHGKDSLRLTDAGVMISDEIIVELF